MALKRECAGRGRGFDSLLVHMRYPNLLPLFLIILVLILLGGALYNPAVLFALILLIIFFV